MDAISWGGDTLGSVIADATATKARLDRLTEQAGSGLVAQTYGGLSRAEASTTLSLGPVLTGQKALQAGIDAVQGRMDVAQTALQGISTIASDFYAKIADLNGIDSNAVDSVAADARDALKQVAGLLDSQSDGSYVFAGDDASNPPVPNPDQIGSSAFASAIAAAVAGLSTNGAAATAASTLAVAGSGAGSVSAFSSALTGGAAGLPVVATGDGQSVTIGVLAVSNGAVASTGSSTTGSYSRDILRALATLGSLSSSQVSSSGFKSLASDTYASLGGAITALNQDAGVLGDRQTALAQTRTTLSDISTSMKIQLSGADQVDMASTLSQLTQAQTQLQSSYQIIASAESLSLTKFLAG